MDVFSKTSIQVIDSTAHYNKEDKWKVHLCSTLFKALSMHTHNNIHINCLVLWFAKAIICYTGECSCISPVDVCYSQYLSFLHHTSISLAPRPLFGPGDVWFWSSRCFTD